MTKNISIEENLRIRQDPETIGLDHESITTQRFVRYLVDAIPDVFLILNEHNQTIFANDATLVLLGNAKMTDILGKRPGEMLLCEHARNDTGGCGTTDACKVCGAFQAITRAQIGKAGVEECRIITENGEALDFRVWTTPLNFRSRRLTIFTLKDISNEKRRRLLERTFFHDIINTAGIVFTYSQILEMEPGIAAEISADILHASQRLINEIKAQKNLMEAEAGDLGVKPHLFGVQEFLYQMAMQYKKHEVANGKQLVVKEGENVIIKTDEALLGRVIGNMIKNALEASTTGDTVTIAHDVQDDHVRFYVHNPVYIPRKVQLQIFQRSFSTKGAGRGIGTYSMRLLSEKYLQGQVSFTSTKADGTTFMATFPLAYVHTVSLEEHMSNVILDG